MRASRTQATRAAYRPPGRLPEFLLRSSVALFLRSVHGNESLFRRTRISQLTLVAYYGIRMNVHTGSEQNARWLLNKTETRKPVLPRLCCRQEWLLYAFPPKRCSEDCERLHGQSYGRNAQKLRIARIFVLEMQRALSSMYYRDKKVP